MSAPTGSVRTRKGTQLSDLPADVPDFVGRDELVAALTEQLTGRAGAEAAVAVISGAPGIGKTATAVRVAHRVRAEFPDGCWFVRLTGPDDTVRDTASVLAELLPALGADPDGLPGRTAALSARFRSAISGRRVLLVLDDAAGAEHVRPLLPGTSGSAVLVTSRMSLGGITALSGIRSHRLTPLHGTPYRHAISCASGALQHARRDVTARTREQLTVPDKHSSWLPSAQQAYRR